VDELGERLAEPLGGWGGVPGVLLLTPGVWGRRRRGGPS
jgi:hypothetical protein